MSFILDLSGLANDWVQGQGCFGYCTEAFIGAKKTKIRDYIYDIICNSKL